MKIPKLRWVIAALLFLATMINYVDRTALSIVSVDVRREFHLNEQDYSHVVTLFLVAYAIMYAGRAMSSTGSERSADSRCSCLAGLPRRCCMRSRSASGRLERFRFMLGLAEPGNWPAAAKAVAEWFPARQRALGIGIFNAGSSIGSAIAPIMVATITYCLRLAHVIHRYRRPGNCLARSHG